MKLNIKLFAFVFFLANFNMVFSQVKYKVVIDPGHGGADPGAVRGALYEKDLALQVSLKVGDLLKKYAAVQVIYTREKDEFVELYKRANIANKANADLFVSIHCNAVSRRGPKGAETFVLGLKGNKENMAIAKRENAVIFMEENYKSNYDYNPSSAESVIGLSVLQEENLEASLSFASLVQGNFVKAKRVNRGVKQANFLVLRQTVMPSVLIELGFVSHKYEGRYLYSKVGQATLANAIAKAILKYFSQIEKNTVAVEQVKEISKKDLPRAIKHSFVPRKGLVYFVQVASAKRFIKYDEKRFTKLSNVYIKKLDGVYTYLYGLTRNYDKAKANLRRAWSLGYKDACLIALKKGRKVQK